jgi:thioesterase domain-containing protein
VDQIRRAGIAINVPDLFNHPTVEALAASALASATPPASEIAAIPVRAGKQTPLFLFHDGLGDELYFPVLARHLPPGLPVYGLPSIQESEPQLNTLEAMASRMIRLIRRARANGPYRLAGWSFGGVLAYEVAQQLLASGEQLELLALIDSYSPDERPVDTRIDESARTEFADPSLRHATPEQRRQLELNGNAADRYRPAAIEATVHLFMACEQPVDLPPHLLRALGWGRWVLPHRLHIRRSPGTHESMMSGANVEALGEALGRTLTEVSAHARGAETHPACGVVGA